MPANACPLGRCCRVLRTLSCARSKPNSQTPETRNNTRAVFRAKSQKSDRRYKPRNWRTSKAPSSLLSTTVPCSVLPPFLPKGEIRRSQLKRVCAFLRYGRLGSPLPCMVVLSLELNMSPGTPPPSSTSPSSGPSFSTLGKKSGFRIKRSSAFSRSATTAP